jgi:hypothetical protein
MLTVSRVHGAWVFASAMPPHRSTTVSPPTVRQTDAPISPFSFRLFSKASATRSKPGRQVPCVMRALIAWARGC